ncbi:MAG: helix-turn-helix transcriptional regulator [Amphritea sp.]
MINNRQMQAEQIVLFSASLGARHRQLFGRGVNLILPMSITGKLAKNYLQPLLSERSKVVWQLAMADMELVSGFIPDRRDLTSAEYRVLVHLSDGLSNEDIAGSLGIRLNTVKVHFARACRKMGVKNRTAAATVFGATLAVNL